VESEEKKRLGGGEKKRRGDAWRHFGLLGKVLKCWGVI